MHTPSGGKTKSLSEKVVPSQSLVSWKKKNVKSPSGLLQGIPAATDASDVTVANGNSSEPQPLTLPPSTSFPSSFAFCPLVSRGSLPLAGLKTTNKDASGGASSLSCSTYTVAPSRPRMGIRFIFSSFSRYETCLSGISPLSLLCPERQASCGGSVPFWSWGCQA